MFENLDMVGCDCYLPFTREKWNSEYTFFVFNLTPDKKGKMQFPDQRASLRLDMTFNPAPSNSVTVMLYTVFDQNIFVNSDGIVTTDLVM